MDLFLRSALCLSVLAISACDEIAVADDPVALADLRGQKSCISAVAKQTQAKGVTINTTIPVIETNYYILNVPNSKPWACATDENGRAVQIVEKTA